MLIQILQIWIKNLKLTILTHILEVINQNLVKCTEELFSVEQYKLEDQLLENLLKKDNQKIESQFHLELLHLKSMLNQSCNLKIPNLLSLKLLVKLKLVNFKY